MFVKHQFQKLDSTKKQVIKHLITMSTLLFLTTKITITSASSCGGFTGIPCDTSSNSDSSNTSSLCSVNEGKNIKEDLTDELVFNTKLYLSLNPELEEQIGNSTEDIKAHWLTHGIPAGKIASPLFDVNYYLETYPELKDRFGDDYEAAMAHWFSDGLLEGRKGSPLFNVQYYLSANPDVYKVYGTQFEKAARHWLNHGIYECRISSAEFHIPTYLMSYRDIYKTYNGNCYHSTLHWLKHGQHESRTTTSSHNYALTEVDCITSNVD